MTQREELLTKEPSEKAVFRCRLCSKAFASELELVLHHNEKHTKVDRYDEG